MAVECFIDRGVLRDCNRVEGPGGIGYISILDQKFFDKNALSFDAEGYVIGLATTAPLTKKFWNVQFEDDNSAYVNDPSTDKTAGAFYRDITSQFRIDDTPANRKFINVLSNTSVVMLYQTNLGKWRLVGTQGRKGMRLTQIPESNSGAAAADKNTMLLNLKTQENIDKGALEIWYDAPVWDVTQAYGIGDYVKYQILTEFHYYKSLTAGNTGNQPDTSPTDWVEVTEQEARNNITDAEMMLITNA